MFEIVTFHPTLPDLRRVYPMPSVTVSEQWLRGMGWHHTFGMSWAETGGMRAFIRRTNARDPRVSLIK